jgi:CheY-like chemotaxis protein
MKKVLIVEDDALLRTVLMHQFEEAGFQVVGAQDGSEGALQYFMEKPDAVVLDVMMPKKTGLEMLEEIRTQDPGTKTPFVVLTNSNEMDQVARAAKDGVFAYVLKSDPEIAKIVRMVEERLPKEATPEAPAA